MVETSISSNLHNSKTFAHFNYQNNNAGRTYSIVKPITIEQQIEVQDKKTDDKWSKIGLIALAAGLGVFGLTKGLPKGFRRKVSEFVAEQEDKIMTKDNKALSFVQKYTLSAIKWFRKHSNKIKISYNWAAIQDVFVKKQMQKTPTLEKFGNWITKGFTKVSTATSLRSYKRAAIRFEKMYKSHDEINKQLLKDPKRSVTIGNVTKTVEDWVDEIEKKDKAIKYNFEQHFSTGAVKSRVKSTIKSMDGLFDDVHKKIFGNVKEFVNDKDNYNEFISDKMSDEIQKQARRNVMMHRKNITNGIADNFKEVTKELDDLHRILHVDDKQTRLLMRKIRRQVASYSEMQGIAENVRVRALYSDISKNLNKLQEEMINSSKYDAETLKNIDNTFSKLKNEIDINDKGEAQEILTIYNKLLKGDKAARSLEYDQVKAVTNSAMSSLSKAVDTETIKLFEKLRDFQLGAAPTDALGVLTSTGVVGYGLINADNKDERVSATLKYGIPAVGGVATSSLFTMALVPRGPSVILGLISGFAINKLGSSLDKFIKRRKLEKSNASSQSV
jgi:hypothetical protein